MFKVPDWECDTSKVNLRFPKKVKMKTIKNKKLLETAKLNGVITLKLKAKKNMNQNFNVIKGSLNSLQSAKSSKDNITNCVHKITPDTVKKYSPRKAKLTNKQKKNNETNYIVESVKNNVKDDKLYDTDKLDELILNEKKQELNSYINDDVEEILFNDNSDNITISNPKLIKNESDKNRKTKKIKKLQNSNKIVEVKIHKKMQTQKQNRTDSENEKTKVLHQLENQILNTKGKRKKEDNNKTIIIQNDNRNNTDIQKTKALHKLEHQILKEKGKKKKDKKSSILQNSKTNNMENEKTYELHQLENSILRKKVKRKKEVQNSILPNNKNNSENKVSKAINPLSDGNKVMKIKDKKKMEALKTILQTESNRNSIKVSGNTLRMRMLERLKAAQFRYINEKLYTSSGSDAKQLFQEDPKAFQTYHEGYQQQVKRWPVKPLDVIVKRIQTMPKTHQIVDMGCGEAELSNRVVQPVRSFDLVASTPAVESCDMAHTPLLSSSMDVAVYCLALMGTELTQYLIEANRVLKAGGHLLIAEVESRFQDVESFIQDVQKLGFSLKKIDKSEKVFFFMEFTKVREAPVKKAKLPVLSLKPCIYKKR